jgi:hypothetical protein
MVVNGILVLFVSDILQTPKNTKKRLYAIVKPLFSHKIRTKYT